ncbi:MAG: septation protein SpoVG family protein [Bacteroidota bacterium]
MNPFNGKGKTKAFFDLETQEAIVIKGLTIVEGQNGMFVGVPQEKRKDDKYYDKVVLPAELKKELQEMAVQMYNRL